MHDLDSASDDPAAAGWQVVDDTGFVALIGPVWHRAADGAYAFRAADKHANLIGVVQGGMLMTFSDRALGVAAMVAAGGANCVTVQMGMQFIGTARIGDWIEARPEVVRRTGSLAFMRTDLTSGERHIGSASGVWKILRRRPDPVSTDSVANGQPTLSDPAALSDPA